MTDEYIKREDVYVAIQNLYPGIPMVKPLIKKWHENNKAYMECETAIARVPAADVRPVVHAKITADGACSACGSYMPTDTRRDAIFGDEVHFCYCCGAMLDADMREVADNG